MTKHQPTKVNHKVNVTSEDVLDCLAKNTEPIVVNAEEVWLTLTYTGNMSGSPRLSKPSRCALQVEGRSEGIMSLLIFNVSCFTDNRLEVISAVKDRKSFDCDPTAWVAPGVELAMTIPQGVLDIQLNDVNTPFSLNAQFRMVRKEGRSNLEVRWVTPSLGRTEHCHSLQLMSADC